MVRNNNSNKNQLKKIKKIDDDTSLLNASMLTSGEMPASFIVSRQESESSFIDYSTEDEVGDSIHHVEHILLES